MLLLTVRERRFTQSTRMTSSKGPPISGVENARTRAGPGVARNLRSYQRDP